MNDPRYAQSLALGLLGAIVGGVAGYYIFFWIAHQGFYAIMLPGWLLGLCAAFCARQRSMPLAVTCTILALAVGLFAEWRFRPFVADGSLPYFLTHLHQLTPITMIMIALGAFLSYRSTATRSGTVS